MSHNPTIILNAPTQKKQGRAARFLDIVSAPLSQPRETFGKGLRAGGDAVRRSRKRIRGGDRREGLKVIGTTLLTSTVTGAVTIAAGAPLTAVRALPIIKKVGGIAARAVGKKPGLSLFAVGLATTGGGRTLLKNIPEKIFTGGKLVGEALDGKFPDLSVKDAVVAGGLAGGAVVLTDKLLDVLRDRNKDKDKDNIPNPKIENTLVPVAPVDAPSAAGSVQTSTSAPVIAKDPVKVAKAAPVKPVVVNIKNNPQINIALAV